MMSCVFNKYYAAYDD